MAPKKGRNNQKMFPQLHPASLKRRTMMARAGSMFAREKAKITYESIIRAEADPDDCTPARTPPMHDRIKSTSQLASTASQ